MEQPAFKPPSTKANFFPLSSLPYMLAHKMPELRDSFLLCENVESGWIVYDPHNVTVLTRNEMFRPISTLQKIYNKKKQAIKVQTEEEIGILQAMLSKPVVFCVTRRQEDDAMVTGFDTDFLLILDPLEPDVACEWRKIVEKVKNNIKSRNKYCLTVDLTEILEELTPELFADHMLWLNCTFHITNYCRPNPLMYLDILYVWCAMLPCCLLISLPYRLYRKGICKDKVVRLNVNLKLDRCPSAPLLLYFYSGQDRPVPGLYSKHKKLYFATLQDPSELTALINVMQCESSSLCLAPVKVV